MKVLIGLLLAGLGYGETLEHAIGLTAPQKKQIDEACFPLQDEPFGVRACTSRFLDESQRKKLNEFAQELRENSAAAQAYNLSLIARYPVAPPCPTGYKSAISKIGLLDSQIAELAPGIPERLRPVVAGGWTRPTPLRPWGEILNDAQKAILAEVEVRLQIAGEAFRLNLISCSHCYGKQLCQ